MADNKDTFVRLYVENQTTIYSFILTLVYDVEAANDLLQDTAVFLWERFDEFKPGSNFANWAVTIARYKVLEHFREKKRRHPLLSDDQLASVCELTKRHVGEADATKILQKCLNRLKDDDRDLLLKRYQDGMTIKQIARTINRPVQGLYKTMGRIFYNLQRCVKISMNSLESGL
jgi:RNA polymerase sigma-70 factor (ECF subfamily)